MPVFNNPLLTTTSTINNSTSNTSTTNAINISLNGLPDKYVCADGDVCQDPSHKHYQEYQKKLQEQLKQEELIQKKKRRLSMTTEISTVRLMPTTTCSLYSGSKFRGEQTSGRSSYDVSVHIQHVNLSESYLCGYLHIKGLTEDYPELTTFFEAEIIGRKYSFLTKKWDADDKIDMQHWVRFPAFKPLQKNMKKDGFVYDFHNKDYIFMRWKEHFLVPDHRVRTINGASFAGFYYICYQLSTGTITGFYFHKRIEVASFSR
ncbi:20266_t:CDS:2 [Entrophospora sp. SA101]|nr:5904_t:CDS:2 [Entrophospora sp. SA101]CAJ0651471.1 6873_t:CDS:2 [Entrophospora sp. SA101]CAJ0757154.1 2938_t:CDS:2 [Entrophospora sp. SA101]CAJ0757155.1 2939_t:CDS:2 [Entrophospora sp. SA101]CAJ0765509.1 20266_t:CDS:2 [Entrophospora sp. SA101]